MSPSVYPVVRSGQLLSPGPQDTPQGPRRALTWEDLPLSPHDVTVCRVRGITPEIAHAYQLQTWTAGEAAANGYRGEHARAGMAIPNSNILGEFDDNQLRPHAPVGERKYLWKKDHTPQIGGMPTGTPEAAARAERLLHDLRVPILADESILKSASLLSNTRRDIYAVAVHGNWNWSKHGAPASQLRWIPRYQKRRGKITYRRPFILVPDSNYWTKPEVMRGWWELGNAARGLNFDVRVAVVPHAPDGTSWGPDDAIRAGAVTVEELIDNAVPLPDIMPAPITRPADEASLSKEERLERENAQLKADNAALVALILNPHITPTDKIAIVSAGTKVQAMAATGAIKPLESAEIANDYRAAKRPKGTPKPTTNPTGTVPLMERGAVKPALERARALGWLEARVVPHTITRSNGTTYTDTAWQVEPTASLGAFLMPAATYTPAAPKERKTYTRQKPCPHCNQVHDHVQVIYCGGYSSEGEIIDGCQGEISRHVVRAPLAQRPEITPEQREHLDNITRDETQPARPVTEDTMSGKNLDIVERDAPVNTSSLGSPINCQEKITTCPADDATDQPGSRVMVCSVCEVPRSGGRQPCPNCGAVGRKWLSPSSGEGSTKNPEPRSAGIAWEPRASNQCTTPECTNEIPSHRTYVCDGCAGRIEMAS